MAPHNTKVQQSHPGIRTFDQDFFSGSQAMIYIGDVWVEDINHFEFSVSQSKQPIYGYASELFDGVSHGNVLVQGSFSINFKESGYLWLVLQRYKQLEKAADITLDQFNKSLGPDFAVRPGSSKQIGTSSTQKGVNNPFAEMKQGNSEQHLISRASIERLLQGEATMSERFQFMNDLAGYATTSNPKNRDRVFEDLAEVFEDEVWKDKATDLDLMARRTDDNLFNDFDIFLVYGDVTNLGSNHTIRRLRNVHLTGSSQVLDVSGECLTENYQFFARSII